MSTIMEFELKTLRGGRNSTSHFVYRTDNSPNCDLIFNSVRFWETPNNFQERDQSITSFLIVQVILISAISKLFYRQSASVEFELG